MTSVIKCPPPTVPTPQKKYHTVRTVQKSNRKIVDRDKFDTTYTQIHGLGL